MAQPGDLRHTKNGEAGQELPIKKASYCRKRSGDDCLMPPQRKRRTHTPPPDPSSPLRILSGTTFNSAESVSGDSHVDAESAQSPPRKFSGDTIIDTEHALLQLPPEVKVEPELPRHPPPPENKPIPTWARKVPPANKNMVRRVRKQTAPEPGITNKPPRDQLADMLCMWLFQTLTAIPKDCPVEVEAKIGTLIDRETNDRLQTRPTISTDAPIEPGCARFESTMTREQHMLMNQYLNEAVERSKAPGRTAIQYHGRRVEVDRFYEMPAAVRQALPEFSHKFLKPHSKIRVTTELSKAENGKERFKEALVKLRVDSMDVICPLDPFDFRVSVNLEIPYGGSMQALREAIEEGGWRYRRKDRIPYQHQGIEIDLTAVRRIGSTPEQMETSNELEVEANGEDIRDHAWRSELGIENGYEEQVTLFLNNVRTLVREGCLGPPPQGGNP